MILTLEEFNKIVDHISSMIEQNCSEEELDEISTSVGAGAYSTPNAFSSDKDSNGSEKLNLDPQFTFSQKPNNSKKNTVNMKEGIQTPIKPRLRLIHTLTQSELEVVSVTGNTVTMKRITAGDPKYKNRVGEKSKTSLSILQKTDNYKVKTNESQQRYNTATYDRIANMIKDLIDYYPHPHTSVGQQIQIISRLLPNFKVLSPIAKRELSDAIHQLEIETETSGLTKLLTKLKVHESIAFHDKHPALAKKYGIVGPFADPKKAAEMGKSQNKSVYTHDGKRHYLVDPKLEKDLEKAGFTKIEESTASSDKWKKPTIDDLHHDMTVKIIRGRYAGATGKIHDFKLNDEGELVDNQIDILVDKPGNPFSYLGINDILIKTVN